MNLIGIKDGTRIILCLSRKDYEDTLGELFREGCKWEMVTKNHPNGIWLHPNYVTPYGNQKDYGLEPDMKFFSILLIIDRYKNISFTRFDLYEKFYKDEDWYKDWIRSKKLSKILNDYVK